MFFRLTNIPFRDGSLAEIYFNHFCAGRRGFIRSFYNGGEMYEFD